MKIRKLFYRVLIVVILCTMLLPWGGGSLSGMARAGCPVTAENWHEVGTDSACAGGISDNSGDSTSPSVAIAPDGTPYVTWYDGSGGDDEIYVRRWNGSSWEEVGAGSASGGGISDNSGNSKDPSVDIAPNGAPYVTWRDDSDGDYEIYVRRWNGSSWEEVGAGSASGGGISDNSSWSHGPTVAIAPDGTPYVAWYDDSSGDSEIYVRRWNGNSWEEVGASSASGGGISDNSGSSWNPSLAIALDDTPYVAWDDVSSGGWEIYVRRWNGSSWEEVGLVRPATGVSATTAATRRFLRQWLRRTACPMSPGATSVAGIGKFMCVVGMGVVGRKWELARPAAGASATIAATRGALRRRLRRTAHPTSPGATTVAGTLKSTCGAGMATVGRKWELVQPLTGASAITAAARASFGWPLHRVAHPMLPGAITAAGTLKSTCGGGKRGQHRSFLLLVIATAALLPTSITVILPIGTLLTAAQQIRSRRCASIGRRIPNMTPGT